MEPSVSKSANEALNSDFFYGWDLLFKTVDGKLDKKADILIVLAHFLLTKHYKFRCIGIGDDVSNNCFYYNASDLLQYNVKDDVQAQVYKNAIHADQLV